jgi:predicted DNA-binding protein
MEKILNFPVKEEIKKQIDELSKANGIRKQFLLARLIELGIKEFEKKHRA